MSRRHTQDFLDWQNKRKDRQRRNWVIFVLILLGYIFLNQTDIGYATGKCEVFLDRKAANLSQIGDIRESWKKNRLWANVTFTRSRWLFLLNSGFSVNLGVAGISGPFLSNPDLFRPSQAIKFSDAVFDIDHEAGKPFYLSFEANGDEVSGRYKFGPIDQSCLDLFIQHPAIRWSK